MAAICRFVVFIALLALCGCMTEAPAPPAVSAAPGQATVTITRSRDLVAVAAPASVDVNGAKFADLALGQSYSGTVRPGPMIVTVTCWCGPGRYSVKFNAEPGKNYAFVVAPRGEQVMAQVGGGLIGVVSDTAINGDQSGTFKITPQ
ncbi:MAG: hypothetical protein ABSA68_13470 [Xanthobacteraceae bacterium]|jgi:hypothetical protein